MKHFEVLIGPLSQLMELSATALLLIAAVLLGPALEAPRLMALALREAATVASTTPVTGTFVEVALVIVISAAVIHAQIGCSVSDLVHSILVLMINKSCAITEHAVNILA